LYVWSRTTRCCHGTTIILETSSEPDARRSFRRVDADGIDLYVDLPRLPESLEVDVGGYARHAIRAYWNGLAWVE
jgi:hypothetical protein